MPNPQRQAPCGEARLRRCLAQSPRPSVCRPPCLEPSASSCIPAFRSFERDRFGSAFSTMKIGACPSSVEPQHIGEKPPLGKIQSSPASLWPPASATTRRRIHPRDARRASGASDLRKAFSQISHVADEIGEIVALAVEAIPVDPADLVILAIVIVCCRTASSDFIAGQNRGRPCASSRQATGSSEAGVEVLLSWSTVGPSCPQLLLWLSLEPRDFPRHWPCCAFRVAEQSASVKPSCT